MSKTSSTRGDRKYLSSPPESSIADVVHMAGERQRADRYHRATGASGTCCAVSWMTDMANYVNQVTGHPNVVIQMGYGVPTSTVKPGSMAIVTYQGSTAEHDEATAKLRTDEDT